MKHIKKEIALLLSVVSLLLCACGGTSVVEPTPEPVVFSNDPESISDASESVVMLNCYDKNGELSCTGSAFQCFEEGIYITNYHVVDGVDKIQGCTEKKLYFDIDEVIAADPDRDIAILKTSADPGVAVLPDGNSDALIKGENVVAIGSPKGFLNTVSKGTYSGVTEFDDGQKLLQFNASVSSGSSGGALFNDKGEIIGITSSQYSEGDDLNFAVPMSEVKEVWENKEDYILIEMPENDWITVQEYYSNTQKYDKTELKIGGYVSYKHNDYDNSHVIWSPLPYSIFLMDCLDEVFNVPDDYNEQFSTAMLRKALVIEADDNVIEEYNKISVGDYIVVTIITGEYSFIGYDGKPFVRNQLDYLLYAPTSIQIIEAANK